MLLSSKIAGRAKTFEIETTDRAPEEYTVDSIWTNFVGCGVKETYVDAAGIRTRVLEAGTGSPLVLLHGTGGHAETYSRNIGPLSKHFHVLAIDMIGHGYTDRPPVQYTMDVFADHVIAVLDAYGERSALLSGESLGGGVACWAALKYPTRVRALALNTGILARPDAAGVKQLDDLEVRTRRLVTEFSRDLIRRRLEWLVLDPASVTDELVDIRYKIYKQAGMVEHMVTLMCTVFEMNRARVGNVDYYSHSLSDLKCPALVIWTDHNPGKSFQVVKPAIDAIPEKEVHLLSGAAHWSQWEKPAEVNALMIEFLTRFSKAGLR
jgi:2-hydroxy-6-oxonona-2,4-dienedioate hydrolase